MGDSRRGHSTGMCNHRSPSSRGLICGLESTIIVRKQNCQALKEPLPPNSSQPVQKVSTGCPLCACEHTDCCLETQSSGPWDTACHFVFSCQAWPGDMSATSCSRDRRPLWPPPNLGKLHAEEISTTCMPLSY